MRLAAVLRATWMIRSNHSGTVEEGAGEISEKAEQKKSQLNM